MSLEHYAAALVAVMLIACAFAPFITRRRSRPIEPEPYEHDLEPERRPWRRMTTDEG
jgi:hypothetical protein